MFEYKILHADGFVPEDDLNTLGRDRWQLVSVLPDDNKELDYIFMRVNMSSLFMKRNSLNQGFSMAMQLPEGSPSPKQIKEIFDAKK